MRKKDLQKFFNFNFFFHLIHNVSVGCVLSILFSFTTFSAETPDYEMVSFENENYRDFSFDELKNLLGNDSTLLPLSVCNQEKELNLFEKPLKLNENKDSLKIKIIRNDTIEIYTYKEGVFLNEKNKIKKIKNLDFINEVADALYELESIPSGKQLLRLLEQSPYGITIQKGTNRFTPYDPQLKDKPNFSISLASTLMTLKTLRKDKDLPFFQFGTGGFVNWNPELKDAFIESDLEVRVPGSKSISLAHEMYHAFDSIRGLLDRRSVNGKGYEFLEAAEYRAVFFENKVRKELGFKYRKFYGTPEQVSDKTSDPSCLDLNGNPIWIPSVCL